MLDKFRNNEFRKDANGRELFFPWAAFGPGYVLETEAQRKSFRNYVALRNVIVFGLFVSAFAWPVTRILTVFAAVAIFEFCYMKVRTRNLVKSAERMPLGIAENASRLSWPLLILLVLGFAAATALPFYMMYEGHLSTVEGWSGGALFGLITLLGGYQVYLKAKLARETYDFTSGDRRGDSKTP